MPCAETHFGSNHNIIGGRRYWMKISPYCTEILYYNRRKILFPLLIPIDLLYLSHLVRDGKFWIAQQINILQNILPPKVFGDVSFDPCRSIYKTIKAHFGKFCCKDFSPHLCRRNCKIVFYIIHLL